MSTVSPRNIIVQTVPINYVIELNKIRYNTNNIWIDNIPPSDYKEKSEQTMTCRWIDGFDYKPYKKLVINLKSPLSSWIIDAFKIGVHTGVFPKAFEDELDMFLEVSNYSDIFNGRTAYFVRTDQVSLKGGQHGVGPYTNMVIINL